MADVVGETSRLKFGRAVSLKGIVFWDLWDPPDIPIQPDDEYHEVRPFDRLDTLSLFYYGDAGWEWVIGLANEIELPPFGVSPGVTLRIPAPRFVTQELPKKVVRR